MDEPRIQIVSRHATRKRHPIRGAMLLLVGAVLLLAALFFARLSGFRSTVTTPAVLFLAFGFLCIPAASWLASRRKRRSSSGTRQV